MDTEIDRLASSINFLREWRYFNYEPRVIRFAPETEGSNGIKAQNEITLSQFTAAEVPKYSMEAVQGSTSLVSAQARKDFVLYAGGLVWALDWCPRAEQGKDSGTNYQFLAVAAHPPDSTYHKLGAPLKGRGMVQIWCILNYTINEDTQIPVGSTKKKYKKTTVGKKVDDKSVRPRGRPRKNPVNKIPDADPENQFIQDLVPLPEDLSDTPHADEDLQSVSASQKLSVPDHDYTQAQKNGIEEETITYKRRKRKPREGAMDEAPMELPESQFIPALAVRLPDTTDVFSVDEILESNSAFTNVKQNKRKVVNCENTTVDKTADTPDSERPSLHARAPTYPQSMSDYSPTGEGSHSSSTFGMGKRRRIPTKKALESDLDFTIAALKAKSRKKSKSHKHHHFENSGFKECGGSSLPRCKENVCGDDGMTLGDDITDLGSGSRHDKNNLLPRAILCLGHDGKVAWDVKWRPSASECVNKYRMGYLAVVLGDGSIEVHFCRWEVPSPEVVSHIYSFRQRKETDPRFAKLKPVFRCSKLNLGDRMSMPLTVEWSASPPHDLLLAGCHDGVVAVWKFSTEEQSEDARPLLCFSAETGPIRSLMWAPFEGDSETPNVIVTAGHGGLKFWDLRDPYRPLWDANPSHRFIYGLDWLPDPSCVLVSYDDGNLRTLSLLRSAYDVPVTGEPFSGTLYQGLHSFNCSTYAIWSIHASRLTGVVAYCCADGAVLYYQLTHKAVDKDPSRNRAPHFLCGSLASEGSAVTLNTELPSYPHRMKKSATEWSNTPRCSRTVASGLNYGKRVKKGAEKSNHSEDVLALCYEDDLENGGTNEASKSKTSRNTKSSKPNKATNNQGLPNADGDKTLSEKPDTKDKVQCEIETLPPKMQAMYRVRWNMNKGSERWLCYGGAAGIVRCQEIVVPEFDKKLLKG
ncbi:hypothetical protein RND81_14G076000 [Saponaria officinalis]|uniref:Uncharacterized protein n=1 Tax=Saponaria officinalis TaxID=3572 RepID=A0AAW1GPS5_SAPOF